MSIIRFIFAETDKYPLLCSMINEKKARAEIRAREKGDYHFCTDGLKGAKLFNSVAEYAFGMILLGLICIRYSITIYAFSLMPNHIHIILNGTGDACLQAFDFLKRRFTARLKKDGYPPLPEDYWFKLVPIETPEQMKSEILYVLRNALEAELGMAEGYVWSSGWLYYSDFLEILKQQPAPPMTLKGRNKWTGGEDEIPESWHFHSYLGLLPDAFVDTSLVLKLFPAPKDLQTALVKDYETFFQIAGRLGEMVSFNKAETEGIVSQTLQKRFEGRRLRELTDTEKGKLAIILNREFGLSSYQISTSIYVREVTVRQLLGSKELR